MQSPSQRHHSMVFPRNYIQQLEIYWILLVGTRKTCVTLGLCHATPLIISRFSSWLRKNYRLVRRPFDTFHLFEADIMHLVRQSYKMSWRCAMVGRPRWPTSISTSGTSINRTCATCFPHFSSNSLLNPIP